MTNKEVIEWRWRSFERLLGFVCQRISPKSVLEWGPGHSTHVILNHALSSRILSIEHHPGWLRRAKKRFEGSGRVEFVHRVLSLSGGKSSGYVGYPLWRAVHDGGPLERYDLVFVDGRMRFDCMMVAMMLVKPKGVVMIHDTYRETYRPAIESYPHFRFFDDVRTAVMSKSSMEFLDGFHQGSVPTLDDGW